jgi:hypothetical protein
MICARLAYLFCIFRIVTELCLFNKPIFDFVGVEVLSMVVMKYTVLWVVTPCSLVTAQHFVECHRLHFRRQNISQTWPIIQYVAGRSTTFYHTTHVRILEGIELYSYGLKFGLLCDSEYGTDIFLRHFTVSR